MNPNTHRNYQTLLFVFFQNIDNTTYIYRERRENSYFNFNKKLDTCRREEASKKIQIASESVEGNVRNKKGQETGESRQEDDDALLRSSSQVTMMSKPARAHRPVFLKLSCSFST